MWETFAVATASVAVGGLVVRHRVRRQRLYADLALLRRDLPEAQGPLLALDEVPGGRSAAFAAVPLARVPAVLTGAGIERLAAEALANRSRVERSYIPTHKQGGTVSYENIHRHAPLALGVFHSPAFRNWLSSIVGAAVVPTADHDQSSCSLLVYTEPGDHIDWHYDHNFYRGRHFTVLICLINQGADGGRSASNLLWRDRGGGEHQAGLGPGDLVVFEGARIRHKVTPLAAGDLRVMLSMTFATDPRIAPSRELARRVKDTAFYGIRALWDYRESRREAAPSLAPRGSRLGPATKRLVSVKDFHPPGCRRAFMGVSGMEGLSPRRDGPRGRIGGPVGRWAVTWRWPCHHPGSPSWMPFPSWPHVSL